MSISSNDVKKRQQRDRTDFASTHFLARPVGPDHMRMKYVKVAANYLGDEGKTKILTSDGAKNGAVDSNRQVSREELKQKIQFNINRMKRGEASKPKMPPRVLLNRGHRGQKKDYYHNPEFTARLQQDEECYKREEEQSHWDCSFFRHCWNEGLKLLLVFLKCTQVNKVLSASAQIRTRRAFHPGVYLGYRYLYSTKGKLLETTLRFCTNP